MRPSSAEKIQCENAQSNTMVCKGNMNFGGTNEKSRTQARAADAWQAKLTSYSGPQTSALQRVLG